MDIQNIGPGARPDPASSTPANDPDAPSTDTTSDAGADSADAQDRVEISDEGRSAQSDQQALQAELLRAQQALSSESEVRPDRVEAAREMVEAGQFSDPEVIGDVAEQMVNDIFSDPGTDDAGDTTP